MSESSEGIPIEVWENKLMQDLIAKQSEQLRDYEAALEFYSSAWRADIYTGPSEELLKDFGSMATEALAKWKR